MIQASITVTRNQIEILGITVPRPMAIGVMEWMDFWEALQANGLYSEDDMADAREAGYTEGFAEGKVEGNQEGSDSGFKLGKSQGYREGYTAGAEAAVEAMKEAASNL